MDTAESIEFFSQQERRAEMGRAAAISAKNYQLLALNSRQLFKSQLMKGLIAWRNADDPRDYLSAAISNFEENRKALSSLEPNRSPNGDVPVERASIVSFLLGISHVVVEQAAVQNNPEIELDRLLFSALTNASMASEAEPIIVKSEKHKAHRLLVSTYRNYFELISEAAKGNELHGLISESEKLYLLRAKDSYYSGGDQTEGGGQDNRLVVDYRLAAVIKKISADTNTMHAWRWN